MKKALTILAIMVIVAGALFADAPAGSTGLIKIKSSVERQDPTFVIKATYGNTEVTGDTDGENLEVNDISQGDVKVGFAIYQTTVAKNRYCYSFSIEVENFKKDGYTVSTDVLISKPTGAWYAKDSANGIAKAVAPKVSGNVITCSVTFNGKKPIDESDTAKTSFDVTWKEDKAAPFGDYEADVTMTIEVD